MNDNVPANVQLDNGNGSITFASEVVATIAGLAATEVEGVTSMGGGSSGLSDIWSRKQSNKSLTRGVRIELDGNAVSVHLTIVADYGTPIPEITKNIQENVLKAIETMSGLKVRHIDIYVAAVSFEREKSTAIELEMQQQPLLNRSQTQTEPASDEMSAGQPEGEPATEPDIDDMTTENDMDRDTAQDTEDAD